MRVGGNANDDEDEHRAADDNHESAAAAEWESRTAVMTLVNAMTNCPEDLEERVRLREEFGRRGLNEVIVVRIFSLADLFSLLLIIFVDSAVYPTSGCTPHPNRCIYGREV